MYKVTRMNEQGDTCRLYYKGNFTQIQLMVIKGSQG